jgi:hypothetical protein
MFKRATIAVVLSLAALATACSSGSSSGTPAAGGSTSPGATSTASPSPGATATLGPSSSPSSSPTSGLTSSGKPPNPLIAKITAHLDREGRIIGPLPTASRSKGVALITRAFQQLRTAVSLLAKGVPGVPKSFTDKFAHDINAALGQEGRDKECARTRSKSLCRSVVATSQRQFSTILDDRNKLNTYNP